MILVVARGATQGGRKQHCRVMVDYQFGTVPAGERKGANGAFAFLDPDAPGMADAIAQLRSMPKNFEVVGDVEAAPSRVTVVAPLPPEKDAVPPLVRHAFKRGWTLEDMAGAGKGDVWDAGGGLAARTGLSIAEMAMSDPPPSWGDMVTTGYPWFSPAWKPPHPGWTVPKVPEKTAPLTPAVSEPDYVTATSDVPFPPGTKSVVVDPVDLIDAAATLTEIPSPADEPEKDPDDMGADFTGARASLSDEEKAALTEYGSDDDVNRALTVLVGVCAAGVPSESKIIYHLGKPSNGTRKPKMAALRAMLKIVSSLE